MCRCYAQVLILILLFLTEDRFCLSSSFLKYDLGDEVVDIRLYELQEKEREKESYLNNSEELLQKNKLQEEKKDIRQVEELLKNKEEQMYVFGKEIEKMEIENTELYEDIKKREELLYQKQTNFKELESMKEKIDELKVTYKNNEEKFLDILEEFEKMKIAVDTEKTELNQRKKTFNKSLQQFQALHQHNTDMAAVVEDQIKMLYLQIDPVALKKYYKYQEKYPLDAIAMLEHDNKCTHCRVDVSVVKLRQIEQHQGTKCETCSRWIVGKKDNSK